MARLRRLVPIVTGRDPETGFMLPRSVFVLGFGTSPAATTLMGLDQVEGRTLSPEGYSKDSIKPTLEAVGDLERSVVILLGSNPDQCLVLTAISALVEGFDVVVCLDELEADDRRAAEQRLTTQGALMASVDQLKAELTP